MLVRRGFCVKLEIARWECTSPLISLIINWWSEQSFRMNKLDWTGNLVWVCTTWHFFLAKTKTKNGSRLYHEWGKFEFEHDFTWKKLAGTFEGASGILKNQKNFSFKFPLNPLRFTSHQKNREKCLLFNPANFWMIKLTKTSILPNDQVPNRFFLVQLYILLFKNWNLVKW